jgi:hypothetical protein
MKYTIEMESGEAMDFIKLMAEDNNLGWGQIVEALSLAAKRGLLPLDVLGDGHLD